MQKPILTLSLLLSSLLVAVSQPATGEATGHFAKEALPLWDLSGAYDDSIGGFTNQSIISHSANGRLTATGSGRYDDDAANTHVTNSASGAGRVTGTLAGGTKGFVRTAGSAAGVVAGSYRSATFTWRVKLIVDSVGNQLVESSTGRTCVTGGKCTTSIEGNAYAFGTNGAWGITTMLAASGNRLSVGSLGSYQWPRFQLHCDWHVFSENRPFNGQADRNWGKYRRAFDGDDPRQ